MAKIAGWDGDRARSGFDGVRLARAMVAVLQEHDATALTQFVLTRKLPIILAGGFNMTPWTDQLLIKKDGTAEIFTRH